MRKFLTAGFLAVLICVPGFAEEKKGNSVTGFFRKLFNYPVRATQETGEMTGNTLNNAGEKVVAATGENTAAILRGDVAKTGELVVDPVVGALQTTGQTVSETVQIPVEAAKDEGETAPQQ